MFNDIFEATVSQEHQDRIAMLTKGYEDLVDFCDDGCDRSLADSDLYMSVCSIDNGVMYLEAVGFGIDIESAEIAAAIALRFQVNVKLFDQCKRIERRRTA